MIQIPSTQSIIGAPFCGLHKYKCGVEVPVFEIQTIHALNQFIGYVKYCNRDCGLVYYRGEEKLYDTLLPSLLRGRKKSGPVMTDLKNLMKKYYTDTRFKSTIGIVDVKGKKKTEPIIEGMLQHYGVKTRYVDLVDNHWVALWMGQNHCECVTHEGTYYHYRQREIPLVEMMSESSGDSKRETLFQYVLLVGVPYAHITESMLGIQESADYILVDLRQALPSTFLRPHAQHGLVIRKKVHGENSIYNYDMAPNVLGILKIRIDRAKEWLGQGLLLSQENLFPSPASDYGYDILIRRDDLVKDSPFSIAMYV